MKNKIFKTISEQIDILKDRGLLIKDEAETKEILLMENYFFVNGYRHMFISSGRTNKFLPGTTFDELYATFVFDRKLRNIFFQNILIIENNIKSIISYQLSKKYGFREKDYLNPNNYTQDKLADRQVKDVLNKVKRQIRINAPKHSATMHYSLNYGYIPMWVVVKVLSFGIMSEFYGILKQDDQKSVADIYGINPQVLEIYLSLLSNFRNVCAHEDILYDHRTQKLIPDTKYHELLNIEKVSDAYIYGKNDLFSLVIMMKYLLRENDFKVMINQIKYEVDLLDKKIDVIPLKNILNRIGFPDNWFDIKNI